MTPTSVPIEDRLPVFNTSEAIVRKAENRNVLVFSIPTRSSVLLKLASPKNHAYEERDHRWLHLLQAVAIVPSRKVDTIHKLVQQAIQLIPSLRYKRVLEQMLRGLLSILTNKGDALAFSTKSLIALRLKDQVSSFLRVWVVDPVEGYVLRKDHVVDGMRRDDLVATPVGAGYLRAYRKEDHMCVVVYPWGHGYIHVNKIEVVQEAIKHERLKRRHNQYLVLEHQHLFEQVESLLENLPEPSENTEGKSKQDNTEEYKQLLESLKEEVWRLHQIYTYLLSLICSITILLFLSTISGWWNGFKLWQQSYTSVRELLQVLLLTMKTMKKMEERHIIS